MSVLINVYTIQIFLCLHDIHEWGRGRVVKAARLRHAATGNLSLSTQQKMGTFFELWKDKAAKGEG